MPPTAAVFREGDHPRGQPGNPGRFRPAPSPTPAPSATAALRQEASAQPAAAADSAAEAARILAAAAAEVDRLALAAVDAAEGLAAEATAEALVPMLDAVRAAKAKLADAEDFVEQRIAAAMAAGGIDALEVPGYGYVERHGGAKRTEWDRDGLLGKLRRVAAERRISGPEAIDLLARCARPEWRVRALRAAGIDPNDYSSIVDGRPSISMPARNRR